MKPTFTPGPWHVVPRRKGYHSERVFADGARYIACVGGSDDTVEDQKANAHLIAAAPELLEALEELLLRVDERCDGKLGGNSKLAMAGDVARAAISRAKGETS